MSLNWKEIDLVLGEIPLVGCRIRDVRQSNYQVLTFELYRPGTSISLLIATAHGRTRIHATTSARERMKTPPRFVEHLRRHIRGRTILNVEQPGGRRIVRIEIGPHRALEEHTDRSTEEEPTDGRRLILWARLWSGAANVILTDEAGSILDTMFRRPRRGEVSGGVFAPETAPDEGADRFSVRSYTADTPDVPFPFSAYIDQHYREIELAEERTRLHARLTKALDDEGRRLQRRMVSGSDADQEDQIATLRHVGDLLTTNLRSIPPGAEWVTLTDFDGTTEATVQLDPKRNPQQNAEAYYRRARKAEDGLNRRREESEVAAARLGQLEALRQKAHDADVATLRALLAELVVESEGASGGTDRPGLRIVSRGWEILVGRSAAENDVLLRRYVRGNDLWLHTRDYAGGYVFVKTPKNRSVPLETLLDAGNLAIHYSKGRRAGRLDLYYTQVKYLRRAKDGPRGLVIPTQEKNVTIDYDPDRVRRILGTNER